MLNPKWLASHYNFFYWRLSFPDVFRLTAGEDSPDNPETGWMGGFDLALGSPPWDTLSPDTKKCIPTYDPQVRIEERVRQARIMERRVTDPLVANRWDTYHRDLCAQVHFFKKCGHYRLSAPGNRGKGDFNIFRMFVERPLQTTAAGGYATQNTPEGLYNGANCMAILKALFEDCRLDRPPRQPDNARQFDNAAIDPQLRRNPGLKLPELIQRAAPDQPVRVAEQQSNPPRGGVRIAKMTKRFAGVAACSPFLVNASTALRQRSDRERNPTPGRLAA